MPRCDVVMPCHVNASAHHGAVTLRPQQRAMIGHCGHNDTSQPGIVNCKDAGTEGYDDGGRHF